MLTSILVYTLTGLVLFALGWHVWTRENAVRILRHDSTIILPFPSWEILLSIVVFALVAGMRYHTGYDHEMYLRDYLSLQHVGECRDYEIGYKYLSRAFSWLGASSVVYFAIMGSLQLGFLYYGLYTRKQLIPWIALYLMLGPWFLWCMNSMRQAVVACVFVSMLPLIVERRWKPYMLIVLLLATLHRSAILLALAYFITYLPQGFLTRRWLLYVVLSACVLLGITPIWMHAREGCQKFLVYVGWQNYISFIDPILQGEFRHVSFGPSRMSNLFINCVIIWFYPRLREYFSGDKLLPLAFVFSLIGMFTFNLFVNTSFFVLRPFEYFLFFVLLMVGYTLCYLYSSKRWLPFAALSLASYTYIYIEIFKAVYRPSREIVPTLYHFAIVC